MKTQFIPDVIGSAVEKVDTAIFAKHSFRVFFDFGHYQEVTKNLTVKGKSISQKGERYPLVWLVMDFEERHGLNPDTYADVNLHLIIAMPTNNNYTMEQRRDEVFVPKLYPIYQELLTQISKSKSFGMPKLEMIEHTKIDRPYWGGQDSMGNGTVNLFNDFIDAIEIKNLRLRIKQIC